MSASNKALLIFIAIVAFAIGAAINSARISDAIDSDTLLTAQLNEVAPDSTPDEPQYSANSINNLLGKKLTLVNFWASWCAPCREEMPLFEAFYQQAKAQGFEIIGVAIDSPEKAKPMLDSMGITYPILYAERTGMEVMESAGNPQGLLPYSLILDENGNVIEQVLGTVHAPQITNWLSSVNINATLSSPSSK